MQAGLFECDHVNAEYRTQFGDYRTMFANLLPELEWRTYDVCKGVFPQHLDECEVYFATGSRHSVYENIGWINQMKTTIRQLADLDKYFVGCCFGHQLLGAALGGRVAKSPTGWCVGVHEFAVTTPTDWMQPMQSPIHLLMMCQDQVLELPPAAQVLAAHEKCPVGIMQVGEKMLGIQAHPEFSKAYDQLLMESRVERMGEDTVNAGVASLAKDVHRAQIRAWILNFLNNSPTERNKNKFGWDG